MQVQTVQHLQCHITSCCDDPGYLLHIDQRLYAASQRFQDQLIMFIAQQGRAAGFLSVIDTVGGQQNAVPSLRIDRFFQYTRHNSGKILLCNVLCRNHIHSHVRAFFQLLKLA